MAIIGYYDGTAVQTEFPFQKNQKVLIIPIDESFPEDNSAGGSLAAYANPSLISKEKEAWKNAAIRKHE